MVDFLKTSLVYLILSLFSVTVVYAQQDETIRATPENIALSFYRTAGVVPNLDSWIKKGDVYRNTIPGRRPKVYDAEMQRLQAAYQNIQPQDAIIRIRTAVVLSLHELILEPNVKEYQLEIKPNANEQMLYFPYDFGTESFVVIPTITSDFLKPMLQDNQVDHVRSTFQSDASYHLIMNLRPLDADISRPYEIDGAQRWVLKTNVLSAEVWSSKGKLVWEYTLPGYLAPRLEAVHKLRQKRLNERYEQNIFLDSGIE